MMKLIVVALLLGGCVESLDSVRKRAAYDFQCPEEKVQVVELGSDKVGAKGCGQQASYVQVCETNAIAYSCKWVR